MADKLSMSLDDIINQNKGQFRTNRGGGRGRGINRQRGGGGGQVRGRFTNQNQRARNALPYSRSRQIPDKWEHDMFEGFGRSNDAGSSKIVISNLDYGVTESDIKELFADFGPIKKSSIHYDFSGRSLGTADVIFERRNDALKALKRYNGVPLDGRAMDIKVAGSNATAVQRIGPLRGRRDNNTNAAAPRRIQQGQERGGQRRGRGGQNRNSKAGLSVEELDAQLEAYINRME